MIRPRGGPARRGGDRPTKTPASPSDIGGMLREARLRRQLDLSTISGHLGRSSVAQLVALESGERANLADQAGALSLLRRYATFLGLDGDDLALQAMEAWSSAPPRTPAAAAVGGGPTPRAAAAWDSAPVTGVVTAVSAGPDHLRAFTQTGQVPRVGGAGDWPGGGSAFFGNGRTIGPPTGMLPVVPPDAIRETRRASGKARRRRRASPGLKFLTWLVGLLVVVALAGVVIQRQRPQWLRRAHLIHIAQPNGQPVVTTSPTTTIPPVHHQTAPSVVAEPGNNSVKSTYIVSTQRFTLKTATSAPCWVEVLSPTSITPVSEGVQNPNTTQSFNADKSITLEVGSSSVLISITINGKVAFLIRPTTAPFTYTFMSKP